jgi:hypothetical protein
LDSRWKIGTGRDLPGAGLQTAALAFGGSNPGTTANSKHRRI